MGWTTEVARILGRMRLDQWGDGLAAGLNEAGGGQGLGLSGPRARAFDRLVDALNRLPRPLMVLGFLAMMAAALIDPGWFAARMDALAHVPEAVWWLAGAIISLFMGGRIQAHDHEFKRALLDTLAKLPPPAQEQPLKPQG